jgi:hypothetical protein
MRSIYHHSSVLNPTSNVTRKLSSLWRKDDYDPSFYDTLDVYRAEEAGTRLSVWARSVLVARRALKILEAYIDEQGLTPPSSAVSEASVDADGWAVKRRAHLRKSLYSAKPRSYFRVFYILAASQARSAQRDREQLQQARATFVRGIIDEALEQAMIYCIRNDNYLIAYAYRRSAVADSSDASPLAFLRGSTDMTRAPGDKKSLTSRILAGITGTSGKGDGSPGHSTSSASASAAALAGEVGGLSPQRHSGKFEPQGRSVSPTPKPSLMGRLLGGTTK